MTGRVIGCQEWDVQYKNVVEKPDYFRDLQDFFRYQMTTKAKEWEHEQEVRLFAYDPYPEHMCLLPRQYEEESFCTKLKRIFKKSTKQEGSIDWKEVRAFLKIGGKCFHSVYFGVKIKQKDKEKIIKAAQMINPDIKIYQMTIDPDAFRLKEKMIND